MSWVRLDKIAAGIVAGLGAGNDNAGRRHRIDGRIADAIGENVQMNERLADGDRTRPGFPNSVMLMTVGRSMTRALGLLMSDKPECVRHAFSGS